MGYRAWGIDILMEVSLLSQYQADPREGHLEALWARGAPQLFATTAVRLAELVLSVRFELIASRSLTQFLCKIYAFGPFWSSPSCTCYVSYVGIKENLLGLVLRFRKIRTEKYVFYFKKYVFFARYFVSISYRRKDLKCVVRRPLSVVRRRRRPYLLSSHVNTLVTSQHFNV